MLELAVTNDVDVPTDVLGAEQERTTDVESPSPQGGQPYPPGRPESARSEKFADESSFVDEQEQEQESSFIEEEVEEEDLLVDVMSDGDTRRRPASVVPPAKKEEPSMAIPKWQGDLWAKELTPADSQGNRTTTPLHVPGGTKWLDEPSKSIMHKKNWAAWRYEVACGSAGM